MARVEQRIYNVERIKPDLEIISTRGSYLIDVVLTHPSAPSRNIKQRKYGPIADARGSVWYGFAMRPLEPGAKRLWKL